VTITCEALTLPATQEEEAWERLQYFDELLQAWVVLATEAEVRRGVQHPIAPHVFHIYKAYLSLATTVGVPEDDGGPHCDGDLEEDRLTGLALIGRLALPQCVQLLQALIEERLGQFRESRNIKLLSHLKVLISCSAFLLCDTDEGEKPMIPQLVNTMSKYCVEAREVEPVGALSQAIFQVVQIESEHLTAQGPQHLDQALAVAAVGALARWNGTYLLLDLDDYGEELSQPIVTLCTDEEGAKQIINIALAKVELNLQLWHADADVSLATCELLRTLCNMRPVRKQLVTLDVWWRLVAAFGAATLGALSRPCVRIFTYCIAVACFGSERWPSLAAEIQKCAGSLSVSGVAADGMLNAAPLIKLGDMLRGLATASSAVMNQGAVDFMAQFGVQMQQLPGMALQQGLDVVANSILKYFCEVVETIGSLDLEEAAERICPVVSVVLKSVADALMIIRSQTPKGDDAKHARQMTLLLRLMELTAKLPKLEQCGSGPLHTLQQGLVSVLPLLTAQLLQIPKLLRSFYTVLNEISNLDAQLLLGLSPGMLTVVAESLANGTQTHVAADVQRLSIETIGLIAARKLSATSPLDMNMQSNCSAFCGPVLLHLLRAMLVDPGGTLAHVDVLSDTIFALILSEKASFEGLVQGLLIEVHEVHRQGLAAAFTTLVTNNGFCEDYTRPRRMAFRANVKSFIEALLHLISQHAMPLLIQ